MLRELEEKAEGQRAGGDQRDWDGMRAQVGRKGLGKGWGGPRSENRVGKY